MIFRNSSFFVAIYLVSSGLLFGANGEKRGPKRKAPSVLAVHPLSKRAQERQLTLKGNHSAAGIRAMHEKTRRQECDDEDTLVPVKKAAMREYGLTPEGFEIFNDSVWDGEPAALDGKVGAARVAQLHEYAQDINELLKNDREEDERETKKQDVQNQKGTRVERAKKRNLA